MKKSAVPRGSPQEVEIAMNCVALTECPFMVGWAYDEVGAESGHSEQSSTRTAVLYREWPSCWRVLQRNEISSVVTSNEEV